MGIYRKLENNALQKVPRKWKQELFKDAYMKR